MSFNDEIAALVILHQGLERKGPGAPEFTRRILSLLPGLPPSPRILDLGCGAGAGSLPLASHYSAPVCAVDLVETFLEELRVRARECGLGPLIQPLHADMGDLNLPAASVDLIWSEGAAYNLTFSGALRTWRPLLAPGGLAVVSELSWFSSKRPEPARGFWEREYTDMASEAENIEQAGDAGFEVLGVERLPAEYWWRDYYNPLWERIVILRPGADAVMQRVIQATKEEMDLFRDFSDDYGYVYYLLRRVL